MCLCAMHLCVCVWVCACSCVHWRPLSGWDKVTVETMYATDELWTIQVVFLLWPLLNPEQQSGTGMHYLISLFYKSGWDCGQQCRQANEVEKLSAIFGRVWGWVVDQLTWKHPQHIPRHHYEGGVNGQPVICLVLRFSEVKKDLDQRSRLVHFGVAARVVDYLLFFPYLLLISCLAKYLYMYVYGDPTSCSTTRTSDS